MLNSIGNILQVLSLFLGFGLCFFGYRFYKLAGFSLGFAAGFLLGYPLASSLIHHVAAGLLGGLLVGLVLGAAFRLFQRLGVFLLGASICGLAGGVLGGRYVGLGAALAGGGIATLYPKPFVVVGTAFAGAFAAVLASWSLTPGAQATAFLTRDLLFSAQPGLTRTAATILGLTAVLGGAGAVIQFSMSRPPVETSERSRQSQLDPRTPGEVVRSSQTGNPPRTPVDKSRQPSSRDSSLQPLRSQQNPATPDAVAPRPDSVETQALVAAAPFVQTAGQPAAGSAQEVTEQSTPGPVEASHAEPRPNVVVSNPTTPAPQVAAPEMIRLTCTRCTQQVVLDRLAAWERALEAKQVAQACVIDASGRVLARAIAIHEHALPREVADPMAAQRLLGVSITLQNPTSVLGAHGALLVELTEIPLEDKPALEPEKLQVPYIAECSTLRTEFISPSVEKVRVIAQRWERMSPEYRVSLLTILTKAGDPFGRALLVSRNALRRLEEITDPIQEAMGIHPPVDRSVSTQTDYGMLYIELG